MKDDSIKLRCLASRLAQITQQSNALHDESRKLESELVKYAKAAGLLSESGDGEFVAAGLKVRVDTHGEGVPHVRVREIMVF